MRFRQAWITSVVLILVALAVVLTLESRGGGRDLPTDGNPGYRSHLDHTPFFQDSLATGPEVTAACLECHEDAASQLMATAHFQWVGDSVTDPRTGQAIQIGKKNLLNNFCISIQGNWESCTRCHAGYGWTDSSFDFNNPLNVDCLVCHDQSGLYQKSGGGLPAAGVDLAAAARSVSYARRSNCGVCHNFGGGGLGVKHGDLDTSLDNPDQYDDIHMGREEMICTDCHGGHGHDIRGKAYSVSVNHEGGIGCTDCHSDSPHQDERLDDHTLRVSCQACHIPSFANNIPTKMWWDWSKAGDDQRLDDTHNYLKIKGEFTYDQKILPEYRWFNLTVDRYLVGDLIDDDAITMINTPLGDRLDGQAKIWPFKIHRGKQPYDRINKYLIPPVTSGEGGYWHEFDWPRALELGAAQAGIEFSGDYGFKETEMSWPLSHMVQAKERALQCGDCHGAGSRLDWQALGYDADPMEYSDPHKTVTPGGAE
jgi:octaheme c-type cytochrome (tetrathionate reductase family)